jgi:hypothetical protein
MKENFYSLMAIGAGVFGLLEFTRELPRALDTLLGLVGIFLVVKAALRKEAVTLVILGSILCASLLIIPRISRGTWG